MENRTQLRNPCREFLATPLDPESSAILTGLSVPICGLLVKCTHMTTHRRFLLAYTGFQYASESSTRRRCLCGSVYTIQPLPIWLTCVCRPTPCVVASNCVPRRLGLCWSRAPRLLPVSTASLSMDHKRGTVCQPISEH